MLPTTLGIPSFWLNHPISTSVPISLISFRSCRLCEIWKSAGGQPECALQGWKPPRTHIPACYKGFAQTQRAGFLSNRRPFFGEHCTSWNRTQLTGAYHLMSTNFKKALHYFGRFLGILGIVFILYRLFERGDPRLFGEISARVWLFILLLGLLYFLNNFLLAFSWQHILKHCGSNVNRRWAIYCYGISQLAKYVPGNIFHLASRQAIGMSYGLPGMSLVKSSFWELSLLAYSGLLYLILASIHWIPAFSPIGSGVSFLGSAMVSLLVIERFLGRSLGAAFGFYMIFLAISALLFSAVLLMVGNVVGLSYFEWVFISASYVVAWLCGLLTPGAPAGIGVREVVLLMLVGPLVPEEHLLIAIILGRLFTIIGDFGFYLCSATVTPPASFDRNSSDENSTTTQTDTL